MCPWGLAQRTGRLPLHVASCGVLHLRLRAFGGRRGCIPWRASYSASRASSHAVTAKATAAEAPADVSVSGNGATPRLSLYNSLTRAKELFRPQAEDGTVSMYVCGVTVYDYSHIGHARVYTSFDILFRYLQFLGYKVNYVRNFTDIDDKIIARAQETGTTPEELSSRFIAEYHQDMAALNCLPPSREPRATEHIQDIVADIGRIIDNGFGYEAGGDVFFDVSALPSYGRLSGRKQEDNRAGERVAVDSRKRSPADFVLWKAAKPGEPQWASPWGPGRPGWHIECSAMIRSVMGPAIDIHGGGRDLIFPHHENEIAQARAAASECECGRLHPDRGFVNCWVHNGFVNVDSEKMSKSLGNFFTIRDVLQRYHPLALRLFLVSAQYRAPINYTSGSLEAAADRMYYMYQTVCDCRQALQAEGGQDGGDGAGEVAASLSAGLVEQLHGGLADDLNTSPVLSALSEALKKMNDLCHTKQGRKAKDRRQSLAGLQTGVQTLLEVLGLWRAEPETVLDEMRALALVRAGLTEEAVAAAIAERAGARKAKDFATADRVREEMAARGVQIMDTPAGTTWRPASVDL